MSDPRERIVTKRLRCVLLENREWALAQRDGLFAGAADWPEIVELAQKILAADAAWLDANTPTVADLMAQYPAWKMRIESSSSHGLVRAWAERRCAPGHPIGRDGFGTFPSALRWLAAKLEDLDSMPPPDEAALDAQRE